MNNGGLERYFGTMWNGICFWISNSYRSKEFYSPGEAEDVVGVKEVLLQKLRVNLDLRKWVLKCSPEGRGWRRLIVPSVTTGFCCC